MPLNDGETRKLIAAAAPGHVRRVIIMFVETGMHPAVMARPVEYGVQIVRGRVLVWTRTKNGNLCQWEIPHQLRNVVKDWMDHDLGYSTRAYHKLVAKVAREAGLDHISPLTLRHTATVRLLSTLGAEGAYKVLRCTPGVLWGTYSRLPGADQVRRGAGGR